MSTIFFRLKLLWRILPLPKHGDITKLHDPNKRKVGLSSFELTWLLNVMKIPWYSVRSLLFFCLEPMSGNDTWIRTNSVTVMIIFSNVLFRKLLDHNVVHSSFPTITRHIDNSILKDILQLKILWAWVKIHADSFIKTWVSIMKRKSTKVPWKLSLREK